MILAVPLRKRSRPCGVPTRLAGRVDHGQDASAERFRQRRPGVENAMQIGVLFDFTGQGMGQGVRLTCRNLLCGYAVG